jgi:pilus assembly protein CpaB
MKNKRALTVMAVAIVFGLAAVVFASRWLLTQPGSGSGRIAVAAADISLGQRLTPEMFKLAEWPADSVPKGAFTDPQKLSGRVLKNNLLMGEPVSEIKLAPSGTLGGLSALITEGKRAITVRVNDVIGVAGFALPGNYVDIIVSTQKDAARFRHARTEASRRSCWSGSWCWRSRRKSTATRPSRKWSTPSRWKSRRNRPRSSTWRAASAPCRWRCATRSIRNRPHRRRHQADAAAAAAPPPAPKPAPKPAPARPAPVVVKVAAPVRRDCVTVLNGLRMSQECF